MMNTDPSGRPSAGKPDFDRREFLRGTAWMGLAAAAAGCQLDKVNFGGGAPMAGFVAEKKLRPPREFLGTEAYRDLRWVYCLQNGLSLGIETVDLAKIGQSKEG